MPRQPLFATAVGALTACALSCQIAVVSAQQPAAKPAQQPPAAATHPAPTAPGQKPVVQPGAAPSAGTTQPAQSAPAPSAAKPAAQPGAAPSTNPAKPAPPTGAAQAPASAAPKPASQAGAVQHAPAIAQPSGAPGARSAPAAQPGAPQYGAPVAPHGSASAPAAGVTPPPAAGVTPPPATPPSLEATERARVAYARGQAAFAAGDYVQALLAFQEAFESVPKPIVLLSVAESAAKLGKLDVAIAALDRYLALRPDSPDRAQVADKRAALAASPAHLHVTSTPAGARIFVDDVDTGKKTPTELQISPGAHELRLELAGYEAEPVALQAGPGARLEQAQVLRAPPPPPPAAAVPPPVAIAPAAVPLAEVPTTALWVTGSIGAAGLIAGTVLGFLALKEHSDYDSNPSEAAADRGERLALFADVGFGVGAMAAVTAAVLYFTHDDVEQTAPQDEHVQLVPKLSPNSASATARIRF